MRWAQLFADLEAQASGLVDAELAAEVAERTRIEAGRLTVGGRLGGAVGHPVALRCAGVGPVAGRLEQVGADWVLLGQDGADLLVPLGSVLAVGGLGRHSTAPATRGLVLGIRSVLRGIARDRSPVRAVLVDGTPVVGTVDRVGADLVEIAEHGPGEPRRAAAVGSVRLVPLAALAVLRRG